MSSVAGRERPSETLEDKTEEYLGERESMGKGGDRVDKDSLYS